MFKISREKDVRIRVAWIAGLAACALAIALIMVPPVIGMADSGDFGRVLSVSGFRILHPERPYDQLYFNYAQQHFGYGGYAMGGYVSTHVVLAAAAGWIGRIFNGETFDIRFLGACYAILIALAISLFVRYAPRGRTRAADLALACMTALSLLFVFGDIGYLAYFHSFFGEPYALVALLLTIASALALSSSDRPSGKLLALFVGAALAVATSKIQNAPLGFAFALLAWRMLCLRSDRRWKRQVWTGAAVLLAGALLMIVAAPDRLKHTNLYQSIFYGVLKDSPNLERDMNELGIPEKYAPLAGTNYFQKGTAIPQKDPVLRREVLEKLSHGDIAAYYARHPSRFMQKLDRAAENAMHIRPYYLGNYDLSAGKPPGALTYTFSGWSRFKAEAMPRRAVAYFGLFAVYLSALAIAWLRSPPGRKRLTAETMSIVALAAMFSCAVPLIGDGEADLAKHLFMFNVCFDLMAISVIVSAVYGAFRLAERHRTSPAAAHGRAGRA